MRRSLLATVMLLAVLLLGLVISLSPSSHAAMLQTTPAAGNVQMQVELPQGGLPIAPAFVLLRRINLDAGGVMPTHSHPGLAMYYVESGTLAVTVSGKALLSRATSGSATPTAATDAPLDQEFRMRRGDTLITWPQTPKTYHNPGTRATKVLAAFLLPAGHQHPPTISYLNGASSRDIKGVTPEFLGDAIAPALPTGPSVVAVDLLKLAAGQPIPAFDGPLMVSVVSGSFDFTTVSGFPPCVSRSADQSVVCDPKPGTSFSLGKSDAAFFGYGLQETARPAQGGELQVRRLTVQALPGGATPSPTAQAPSVIEITAPATPASPAATAAPTQASATQAAPTTTTAPTGTTGPQPTAAAPTATPTQQAGKFKVGDVVAATDDGVNLRSAPSTDASVVTTLSAGQQMTITGPSQQGSGHTWWPVSLVDDPTVTGFVAEDFIQKVGG